MTTGSRLCIMDQEYLKKEQESLLSNSELTDKKHLCISKLYAASKLVLHEMNSRKTLGVIVIAAVLNALRGIMSKVLLDDIHPLEMACIERTVMCLCSIPFLLWKGLSSFKVSWSQCGLIVSSGTTHAVSSILLLISYQTLEVGYVTAIISTRPVFVAIFGALFLREQLSRLDVASVFLTFTGLIILANPVDLFTRPQDTLIEGILLAISSTLFAASNSLAKRLIGVQKIDPQTAVFYNAFTSAIISGVSCTIFGNWSILDSWFKRAILISEGIASYLANVCIFWALWTESAFHVTAVGAIKIPIAFLLQFLILSVMPDIYGIVGSVLVILSVVGIAYQSETE
ncbi:solute carrier family 35 member G1-like [Apostichopus japonicus]|uniref:solute carrier family 35 member G1-like n=1 Tax=Stichopus japonicus TaxID=307972 RepID=UPI003AB4D27A